MLRLSICVAVFAFAQSSMAGSLSLKLRRAQVAKCQFVTKDMDSDSKLPPFYIPVGDKELYESGVKSLMTQLGDDSLSVDCQDSFETNVQCSLCLYNDVSSDHLHVVQGQVMNVDMDGCMSGVFASGTRMPRSEYHPICYPATPSAATNTDSVAAAMEESVAASDRDSFVIPSDSSDRNTFVVRSDYGDRNSFVIPSVPREEDFILSSDY
jgi:hypothetical protein